MVPDDLALDFTKKPFIRNDQSTKLQKLYKKQLNEIIQKSGQVPNPHENSTRQVQLTVAKRIQERSKARPWNSFYQQDSDKLHLPCM